MNDHPVVIVGAGPVGLAAAAELAGRQVPYVVLERGSTAGAAIQEWGHVRLFSPWSELIAPAALPLLAPTGWRAPVADSYPTGAEWVEDYLAPLAAALGDNVRYEHTVIGLTRRGLDRVVDEGRDDQPFLVRVRTPDGGIDRVQASAVVDASGTWTSPNPLGADGQPALGEDTAAEQITYQVPDFTRPDIAARYAGRHVAVAGNGHSALTALVLLTSLPAESAPAHISWLLRRDGVGQTFGGGAADQLPARGALGTRAKQAVQDGRVDVRFGFRTDVVEMDETGRLSLRALDGQQVDEVDEVIAATGFRPDLTWLDEVRLDLDPILQAPTQLAPLIDPNQHSCGTVYPHGYAELGHPERNLYLAGMKSYGRAPTFLALTGFEQVRSIVAALAGDLEAAQKVELTLPETGVCSGGGLPDGEQPEASGGCCAPEPQLVTLTVPSRHA